MFCRTAFHAFRFRIGFFCVKMADGKQFFPIHSLSLSTKKAKGSPIRAGVNRQNAFILNFLY
jgi:hypothetical protein